MSKKNRGKKHGNKTVKSSSYKSIRSPIKTRAVLNSVWLLPLISLALLIITLSLRKIANYDVGFHLASGRWIIENFAFPFKDIFTYTVSANDYIDILWLYQVLFYISQSLIGYSGLTILNSLLILLVFYMMFTRMNRAGIPFYISFLILTVSVFAMQIRFSYRPEVFTWIFILCILYILDGYYYSGKKNLFWLPVIMLFWVNVHGLFIIGLIIITAYTFSIYFHNKKADLSLLKWFGLSIIAVFINPYFADGALFPAYLFTRLQAGNIFKDTITELQSPWAMTGSIDTDLYIYYAITIISLILFALTYKKRHFHQYVLFIAFFFISYQAFRNIPIFIIYALHISALSLSEITENNNVKNLLSRISVRRKIISIVFSVILMLTLVRVISGAFYWKYNSSLEFGVGLDQSVPEKACDFINEKRLGSKMINILGYGGWLEWKLRQPVFIDGRLEVMKEEFYAEYINGLKTGGLNMLINKYDPKIVINDIGNYVWNLEMKKQPGWKLVYYDNTSTVFTKFDGTDSVGFDFISALQNEDIDIKVSDDNLKFQLIKDTRVYKFSDWVSGFYTNRIVPVELLKMGNFVFDFDRYDEAELYYLEFLKRSSGIVDEVFYYDVFNNLANVYFILKKYIFAVSCCENCLKIKPFDKSILAKITELKKLLK